MPHDDNNYENNYDNDGDGEDSNKDHNIQSGEQQENVLWSFNNMNIAQQKSHHYQPPMFEWVWIWPGVRCPRNRSENPPKNGPPEAKFEQFLYLIKFEIKSLISLPKGKFLLNREVFSVHNSPTKSQSVATFKEYKLFMNTS